MRSCVVWLVMGACLLAQAPSRSAILEQQLDKAPDRGIALLVLASTCAAEGAKDRALHWMRQLVELKAGVDPTQTGTGAKLQAEPEFQRLAAQATADNPPITRSRTAFTVADKELIPEGLAWDPATRKLYLGSIHKQKIVEIVPDGTVRDFVASGQDGLKGVLGMKVDPRTKTLWAGSSTQGQSGVFHYDLRTGRLIRKYVLDGDHLFNDLVVTSAGDVYVTNSNRGALYWISRASDTLAEFLPGVKFDDANGIALSGDEKKLYVSAWPAGIMVVNLETRTVGPLAHAPNVWLAGIDGLYAYGGGLLAIQNAATFPRVVRVRLVDGQDRVESVEVLERRHPLHAIPTTGAVAGNEFYYIANSHIDHLPDDTLVKPDELTPVVILLLKLER
jgi:hypothetical protein